MNCGHSLSAYVQHFFTERLVKQLNATPNTIATYRDTFRLLFRYAEAQTGRAPTELRVEDINFKLIEKFLTHYEQKLGNTARSRNTRLAGIRSLFQYISRNEPQLSFHCMKVLAIPTKRHVKRVIDFLNEEEIQALVDTPDCTRFLGRRDRTLLLLMVQTGLRLSEVVNLQVQDIRFGTGAHVWCTGKGRKERITPLRPDTRKALRNWIDERGGEPKDPLFITSRGMRLSHDAVQLLVRNHTVRASEQCPTLVNKRVTPHVLRHTAAMQLLRSGVALTVIALWLGHESVETTQIYIHADTELKERAMARTQPVEGGTDRFRPTDELIKYLDSL